VNPPGAAPGKGWKTVFQSIHSLGWWAISNAVLGCCGSVCARCCAVGDSILGGAILAEAALSPKTMAALHDSCADVMAGSSGTSD
jgi:hypothetical protein